MRYKNIILFSFVTVITGIVIRAYQLLFITEGETGFIKQDFKSFGIAMSALVVLSALACVAMGLSVRRCPKKMPKVKWPLSVISFIMAGAILFEIFTSFFATRLPAWQVIVLEVTGCCTAAFFVVYGLKPRVEIKLPNIFYAVPVLYWAVKLMVVFTSISSLALIVDNVLLTASYCAILIFMLEFAKLANGIDIEKTSRFIMASGLCAVNLSLVCSIPSFIALFIGNTDVLHTKPTSLVSALASGLFILIFICSYFSNQNLSKRRRRHVRSHRFLPSNGTEDNFYLGSGFNDGHSK